MATKSMSPPLRPCRPAEAAASLIPVVLRARVPPVPVAAGLLVPRPVDHLHVVVEGPEHLLDGFADVLRVVPPRQRAVEDCRQVALAVVVLLVVEFEVLLRAGIEAALLKGLELSVHVVTDDDYQKVHTPPCKFESLSPCSRTAR